MLQVVFMAERCDLVVAKGGIWLLAEGLNTS
jgi:hypothetical protein